MSNACIYPKCTEVDIFKNYSLCSITEETENYFIGSWVTGFGFYGLKFPKSNIRELYWYEKLKYSKCRITINNSYSYGLGISCNYYPDVIQMLEDINETSTI